MDAVGAAKVECAHVSSGIYFAKNPAFCFDSAVPFGLDAGQMNAWMLEGDGPVSYTHLDVYKRQVTRRSLSAGRRSGCRA